MTSRTISGYVIRFVGSVSTVTKMVQENHRLLVFTSDSSKEAAGQGIAYQWRYMVENEPGDGGVVQGSCPNRKESKPLNSKSASLFLHNYFPTIPVQSEACKEHSASLVNLVGTCYKSAGNVMPNFLAVNFYMRSDGGLRSYASFITRNLLLQLMNSEVS